MTAIETESGEHGYTIPQPPQRYLIDADSAAGYSTVLTFAQASAWASQHTGRNVTPSNIAYLAKYGRITPVNDAGSLKVSVSDLERYYQRRNGLTEESYKRKLGSDINWELSFERYKEAETTKHVHRLHPYKGKFIPQLVEYFLDSHVDDFKAEACFAPGDIILDPFCGSGTTLVQANELGMNAIGIDVSLFNTMISNIKLSSISLAALSKVASDISNAVAATPSGQRARAFEEELLAELKVYNSDFFPSPKFRWQVRNGEISEDTYAAGRVREFRPRFNQLLAKHRVSNNIGIGSEFFLDNWFLASVRNEINSAKKLIDRNSDPVLSNVLRLVLSRTVRSSRATTHSDLATLVKPVTETYYCGKHSKICKPLFSMLGWWRRYADDTVKRKSQFEKLRTDTLQACLTGDSRNIDIEADLFTANEKLGRLARERKIRGIFSSPPYVGLIDYHEQHAYAYELFNLPRSDSSEIGAMFMGRGKQARQAYVDGIAQALSNCQRYMVPGCDIFLVANDKFGLYPHIAEKSNLRIVKEYKRPVLNRSEGDKGAYSETIFHMRRA